jgi:hypothetical protein
MIVSQIVNITPYLRLLKLPIPQDWAAYPILPLHAFPCYGPCSLSAEVQCQVPAGISHVLYLRHGVPSSSSHLEKTRVTILKRHPEHVVRCTVRELVRK